jgi:putative CocE/NonD family hydrolase
MGINRWRDEDAWPPQRSRAERWFLQVDSLLSPRSEGEAGVARFRYDPSDPVPTVGGNTLIGPAFPAGPSDQREIEERDDVLVFTSPPLERDLELTGRVRVVLSAASSAGSTDWVARLCDVHPDGRSINVCDGILRVEDGGRRAEREIDLWSTSIVLLKRHRLRVDVTSSSFPRWDRNLNTGDQAGTRMEAAEQRVYVGDGSSYVQLPVVR